MFYFDIFTYSKIHSIHFNQTKFTDLVNGKVKLAPLDFLVLCILGGAAF